MVGIPSSLELLKFLSKSGRLATSGSWFQLLLRSERVHASILSPYQGLGDTDIFPDLRTMATTMVA